VFVFALRLHLLESYDYGAPRCAYGPTCLKQLQCIPAACLFRRDKGDHMDGLGWCSGSRLTLYRQSEAHARTFIVVKSRVESEPD